MNDHAIREYLAKMLAWEDAHVGFEAAVADIPEEYRGRRAGAHSLWELVEHLRITQHDILDFSRNSDYHEMEWPKDYWPARRPHLRQRRGPAASGIASAGQHERIRRGSEVRRRPAGDLPGERR